MIVADTEYPTIRDLVNLAESASRPPASGPRLAYEVRVREEGGELAYGNLSGVHIDSNKLVLDDANTTGFKSEFMAFGANVPPVSQVIESHVEWVSSGTVNVFVSEDPNLYGWTQIQNGDPVPFWGVGDTYFAKRLWLKIELVGGTSPEVSVLQVRTLLAEKDTSVDAPWPTALETARWLWDNATPDWWTRMLGGKDAVDGSLDYRVFRTVLTGLVWARLLLDRGAVRLDPAQALPEDFERLTLWANADAPTLSNLSNAYKRSYIANSRSLARHRGTKLLERIFRDMFATSTLIEWKPDSVTYPHRRVVTVSGPLEIHSARVLLRRHFPASVEIELHYVNAAPPVTGFTYTGFDSSAIGETAGTYYDYGWTLGEGETVDII